MDYEEVADRNRAGLAADPGLAGFIRFATLAANAHNTQPWKFSVAGSSVSIRPDLERRTPIVDPDDHHLFVSLGCAAENLAIAAAARGRHASVHFVSDGDGAVSVDLGRGAARDGPLFEAIPKRQVTRSDYDGRKVSDEDLRLLETAAREPGVETILITDEPRREEALEHVIEANSRQLRDPAFRNELRHWIRFSKVAAIRTGDGLYGPTLGSPAIPQWLGRMILGLVLRPGKENDKYARQVRSSAGLAVFVADAADKAHWVSVGRSYQRFALQATALGIKHAFLNQPVEIPEVRSDFASWLGTGGRRPDLVVRFGRAPDMVRSLRRPVADVMG